MTETHWPHVHRSVLHALPDGLWGDGSAYAAAMAFGRAALAFIDDLEYSNRYEHPDL